MIGKLATSLGILLALGASTAAFAHGSSTRITTVWYSGAPAYYSSHDARHHYTRQPSYRGPIYSTRYGAIPPQHRSVVHGIVITSPLIRTHQNYDRSYHNSYNMGYDKRRDHNRDRKRYDFKPSW